MSKGKKVFLAAALAIAAFFVYSFFAERIQEGFKITITNELDQPLEDLVFAYPNGPSIVSIDANAKKTIKILPKDFSEASIDLIYKNEWKHTVIGYIEPGYKGKAHIKITRMKASGQLEVAIKEEIRFY